MWGGRELNNSRIVAKIDPEILRIQLFTILSNINATNTLYRTITLSDDGLSVAYTTACSSCHSLNYGFIMRLDYFQAQFRKDQCK